MVDECDDLVRTVSPHLDVERVRSAGGVVRIAARTRELMVACPDCGLGFARVHSRSSRALADVAVGARPALIRLLVRRLFCDTTSCGRRTFAEQVEGLTVRYQGRSPLLHRSSRRRCHGRLTDDQAQQLKTILTRCPALDRTSHHVRAFAELMNDRQGKHLDQWIAGVQADDLPALHTFVTGLGQDLDAVVAGLSLRYSSGAVEGHNNKIKMLKRQMFGRANFDLLRKRVLLTARGRS
jgi:hypothetical protein